MTGRDAAPKTVRAAPKTLRAAPEEIAADELAALAAADDRPRPPGWALSPWATATFLLGGSVDGTRIAPKYYGDRRLIEVAIASLAANQSLLLVGPPGVAKSRVAEHLAAAISGDSGLVVQGSAGLDESQLRYGWSYAELLARGPSRAALTPTPLLRALELGRIVRIEELTRIPSETQDALITVLSEKTLAIPELSTTVDAQPGFNVVATANLDDRGTNRLSAALRRRFNVVALPPPATLEEEVAIIAARLAELGPSVGLPAPPPSLDEMRRLAAVFRDLRAGEAIPGGDDPQPLAFGRPSGGLSTADAISAALTVWSRAAHFARAEGEGPRLPPDYLAEAVLASAVADPSAAEPAGDAAWSGASARDEDRRIVRDYATGVLALRARDAEAADADDNEDWAALGEAFERLL